MAKIHKISDAVKEAIKRKSVHSLPDNPTDYGYKAADIKNTFFKPIIDESNSVLAEIDRVVDETNAEIERVVDETNAEIERVAGEINAEIARVADETNAEISNLSAQTQNLSDSKLDKITDIESEGVYAVSPNGNFIKPISTNREAGSIPVYSENGCIAVGTPLSGSDAVPWWYAQSNLGCYIECKIDSDYKLKVCLNNVTGETLSEDYVDLPLESMILGASYSKGFLTLNIKTSDGSMNNESIKVNISDLVSGLVSQTAFEEQITKLEETMLSKSDKDLLITEIVNSITDAEEVGF